VISVFSRTFSTDSALSLFRHGRGSLVSRVGGMFPSLRTRRHRRDNDQFTSSTDIDAARPPGLDRKTEYFVHISYQSIKSINHSLSESVKTKNIPKANYIALQYLTWWCNGKALDLRSVGRGFKSCLRQRRVTTSGKLFTPMCLCHQAV